MLGYYLASLSDFIGLRYISAGLERLILFVYPTLVVVLEAGLFKIRLERSPEACAVHHLRRDLLGLPR